jgi:uncharacterized protein YqeY
MSRAAFRPAREKFGVVSAGVPSSLRAVDHEEPRPADGEGQTVRDRLRGSLRGAMKQRDSVAVAALRSALAAIDNAEAVEISQFSSVEAPLRGLGAGDVARRHLSAQEMDDIVRAELSERLEAAATYDRGGQQTHAERLRRESDVIAAHLDGPDHSRPRHRSGPA